MSEAKMLDVKLSSNYHHVLDEDHFPSVENYLLAHPVPPADVTFGFIKRITKAVSNAIQEKFGDVKKYHFSDAAMEISIRYAAEGERRFEQHLVEEGTRNQSLMYAHLCSHHSALIAEVGHRKNDLVILKQAYDQKVKSFRISQQLDQARAKYERHSLAIRAAVVGKFAKNKHYLLRSIVHFQKSIDAQRNYDMAAVTASHLGLCRSYAALIPLIPSRKQELLEHCIHYAKRTTKLADEHYPALSTSAIDLWEESVCQLEAPFAGVEAKTLREELERRLPIHHNRGKQPNPRVFSYCIALIRKLNELFAMKEPEAVTPTPKPKKHTNPKGRETARLERHVSEELSDYFDDDE